MRVGLLGGSFDPIHRGHLALGRAALRQLKLDRVYFVVSPRSPFKLRRNQTPPPLRLAMVKLAVKGRSGFHAADWEIKRRGPSFTVTTLRRYRRTHPSHALFLILGSDALRNFGRWKEPRVIAAMATLLVGQRPGASLRVPAFARPSVRVLRGVFPPVSSTRLRKDLAAGRSPGARTPVEVARFIATRNLYRSSGRPK